ncbi:unnamed protein product [Mucor hiemalis]
MIAQGRISPLSFSRKENSVSSSVLIDQFLKEALQILKHADTSLCNSNGANNTNNQNEEDDRIETADNDTDADSDSVTWQLNLTPTMMTLDTSILTVSGLEKVLELIRINVKPQPPKFKDKKLVNSDRFDISIFQQMIEPVLRLSAVMTIPRTDQLSQFNSMQLMRHCVQGFIDCGNSFFVDVPSLLANADMILSHPGAAKEHAVETLLILSICTLMIRHTTIHHRGDMTVANALMHAYYAQARQLLQDLFDVHHISVVQSMFILSLFPQGHIHLFSPARIKSPLLSMAIRMALTMDLHKLDLQHNKESDQKEKLRRLAWMILCTDYFTEWNSTGHTGVIDVSEWHVDFPQPLPSENSTKQIEFFSQYCRIIMIRKMELFKSAYMISLQSPKALKSGLDEQLFQTYFNTPDMFKLNIESPTGKSDLESLLLHELHCHTQIFARIPFLPRHYFKDFQDEEGSSRCTDLNDINQRIVRLSAVDSPQTPPPSQFVTTTSHQSRHRRNQQVSLSTEGDLELEFYCLVGCLTVMNNYTQILEALTSIDTIGCHHSPVYGAMLTAHLYLIIDRSCRDPEVRSVCQINLMRTHRMLRQARTIYADPAILFLERMLFRHNIVGKEEVSICTLNGKSSAIIRSLQAKSSYSHQAYDDDEDSAHHIKLE